MIAKNFEINNQNIEGKTLTFIHFHSMTGAVISRVMHNNVAITPTSNTVLHKGDLVRVVGTEDSIKKVEMLLGEISDKELPLSNKFPMYAALVTIKMLSIKHWQNSIYKPIMVPPSHEFAEVASTLLQCLIRKYILATN